MTDKQKADYEKAVRRLASKAVVGVLEGLGYSPRTAMPILIALTMQTAELSGINVDQIYADVESKLARKEKETQGIGFTAPASKLTH